MKAMTIIPKNALLPALISHAPLDKAPKNLIFSEHSFYKHKMFDLLDIARYFDPIDRFEGAISTFLNADWSGAMRRQGPAGLLTEFMACLTSHNAPTIRISRKTSPPGIDIERLLNRYGVKVWDRGASGAELYFCVKRRQVKWAEYVLLRAGIPVTSSPAEPRNSEWAAQYSDPPPQNRKRLASKHPQKRAFFDFF